MTFCFAITFCNFLDRGKLSVLELSLMLMRFDLETAKAIATVDGGTPKIRTVWIAHLPYGLGFGDMLLVW